MYATRTDMVDQFGEREVIALTDRDRTNAINDAVLNRALVAASSEADGYLAGRYTTPLPNVSAAMVSKVCDIARYQLCGAGVRLTDEIEARYKAAIRYMEKASLGEVTLASPGGADPGAAASVRVVVPRSMFGDQEGAL